MKLVCIDDVVDILKFGNGKKELTYGKEYDILLFYQEVEGRPRQVCIINDIGKKSDYRLDRFVSIDQYRDIQINKILK